MILKEFDSKPKSITTLESLLNKSKSEKQKSNLKIFQFERLIV